MLGRVRGERNSRVGAPPPEEEDKATGGWRTRRDGWRKFVSIYYEESGQMI